MSQKSEIRFLLKCLQKAGWDLDCISDQDNGEEITLAGLSKTAIINEITAADDCLMRVKHKTDGFGTLYLVFGNSPGELVCDYTDKPSLDLVVDQYSDHYE